VTATALAAKLALKCQIGYIPLRALFRLLPVLYLLLYDTDNLYWIVLCCGSPKISQPASQPQTQIIDSDVLARRRRRDLDAINFLKCARNPTSCVPEGSSIFDKPGIKGYILYGYRSRCQCGGAEERRLGPGATPARLSDRQHHSMEGRNTRGPDLVHNSIQQPWVHLHNYLIDFPWSPRLIALREDYVAR
jgi:hypothetical protein